MTGQSSVLYDLANIGIVLGYFVLGALVIPTTKWKHWWTAVAAALFFITCGIHHAMDIGSTGVSAFMVVDDVIQFFAVWTFFIGLAFDRGLRIGFRSRNDA